MPKQVPVWKWRYWHLPSQKWVVTRIYMTEEFAHSWIRANDDWPADQLKIEKIPSTMRMQEVREPDEWLGPSLIPK